MLWNWSMCPAIEGNASIFVSKLTPGGDMGVGFTILTVVLLSLLGNGLVLAISYRRRRKIVGSELLCVNLALVDFLCCILFYPLSVASSFSHAWLGCYATCTYYGLGCFTFGLCGMFTITAISVIRYLKCNRLVYVQALKKHAKLGDMASWGCRQANSSCNKQSCSQHGSTVWLEGASMRLLCCATWLVAAAWSCFPLLGWGAYVPEPYGLSCTVAWKRYHASVKDAVSPASPSAPSPPAVPACFTFIPVLLIVACGEKTTLIRT
ncbi:hypothetical protein AAFF_G00088420 [Aldrovandia affinis]|uniref:G-protein coupled receptors family 1 profile domain-containing protein n=1 Tax=Aldrovandia affinis TaxID=143900 RepID=A0AAD7RWG3_9TELE|nr:hypothetical protein AAFF_G00088420 [Aldrovandia affinis]